ncbi:hypothetical protein HID58_059081 [Brassica napus]|uniref:Uncharacterized protein n=1 Tax=Brassica napus TaxID=3708 RepID=A0ABQ7ZSL6_BRANA|nr:hypothetical protein HID58_059081 [Brassica napus]
MMQQDGVGSALRVATPRKKKTPTTLKNRKGKRVTPDAVFNSQVDQEAALNDSVKGFLREFKLLIKVIKEGQGHVRMSVEESKLQTLRSQLDLFDKAWCAFLNSFVLWKVKDARLLGEDKVRAACQLQISMIQKCKITPERDDTVLTYDKKAIQTRNTEGITKLPRRIH